MTKSVQVNFSSATDQDDVLALIQTKYDAAIATPVWTVTPKAVVDAKTTVLFQDTFDGVDGVITNEYAFWNPTLKDAVQSPNWELTSGTLFRKGGMGATGIPDGGGVMNALSTLANNNCIFRCVTKRKDFGDVKVSFDFNPANLTISAATPAVDWDGAHVFLRYQSETNLYYASFTRRDGKVVIKKKVTGGPSNGGTYTEVGSYVASALPLGVPAKIEATIKTVAAGVNITLSQNGKKVLDVTDIGTNGPAITTPGGVGIRGDNFNFTFDNFTVTAI